MTYDELLNKKKELTTWQPTDQEVIAKGVKALFDSHFSAVQMATFMTASEEDICAEIHRSLVERGKARQPSRKREQPTNHQP